MKELPLHPGALPCLRCGYCCKKAPCGFGVPEVNGTGCAFLVGKRPGDYTCGKAEAISNAPGSEASPAFGAGCCSSGNSLRQELARGIREFDRSKDGRVRWLTEAGVPLATFIVTVDGEEIFNELGDFDGAALAFVKAGG